MLFNSYEFILFFLPVTLSVYYWLGRKKQFRISIAWLVSASLFFYAWWNPAYLGLILASMAVNYSVGVSLSGRSRNRLIFVAGIGFNLGLLGYFKYTDFLIESSNQLLGTSFAAQNIILPLAISFFTFQQIAYLVDAWRGETHEYNFLQYALFVSFFPQLIAGPIVHHREMLPQFCENISSRINATNMTAGLMVFFIGLFKKTQIADEIAQYATPVFLAAEQGVELTFFEAWGGALAYTIQLYFDFSGYADMAIGLALMFGIRLPLNFNSPYKSTSIIEFWRRWHMTLSRFLRDYLYIALGGSRRGTARRYLNLLLTMVLGGLWHGAGWTFVIWGTLHGVYLCINHLWRKVCPVLGWFGKLISNRFIAGLITFIAVVVAWVYFRADSIGGAHAVLSGMLGQNGLTLPIKYQDRWGDFSMLLGEWGVIFDDNLFKGGKQLNKTLGFLLVIFLLPNTQIIMRRYQITTDVITGTSRVTFKPNVFWWIFGISIASVSIFNLASVSEFLYFRF